MDFKLSTTRKALVAFLVFILLAFCMAPIFAVSSVAYANESLSGWSYEDCENLRSFMYNNIVRFVQEYNKTVDDDNLLGASGIEYSAIINLVEDKNYGVYIDFNGDNGYAVIAGDYTVYELKVKGDYEILRNEEDLYFSCTDGFIKYDENGVTQRVLAENVDCINDSYCTYRDSNSLSTFYTSSGDGEFTSDEINEYIWGEYYTGSNFLQLIDMNEDLASTSLFYDQFETSFYVRNFCYEDGTIYGNTYSEGNCALSTMYSLLSNWTKNSLISNGSYVISYEGGTNITRMMKDDPLYPEYGTGIIRSDDRGRNYMWHLNDEKYLKSVSWTYYLIRQHAIEKYGYTPESGFYCSNAPETLEYVANMYNVPINVSYTSSTAEAIESINSGKAVYMSISNSSTYGNHAVTLIGYQKYLLKDKLFGAFSTSKTLYFFQIADNWNKDVRYFDPNTGVNHMLRYCILDD